MRDFGLSLREKIYQTVVLRINPNKMVYDPVGAAFFFGEIITEADEMGLKQARDLLSAYCENAKTPVLLTSDFENGCGSMLKGLTPLPYLMSLGAANSEQIAYDYGKATALEARSVGANWTFSPVSDLNLNFRNPLVNVRALGDDPEMAVRLLTQVVRGMQDNGLAACAKHFPGDGLDWRDQHLVTTNNTLPFSEWKKLSGRVFQALINEGVDSIMAGHITLPDYQKNIFSNGMKLPATLSDEIITNLLKKEMGFKGVVVTDALRMGGFGGWYKDRATSEIESFKAGCDMMLWPCDEYVDQMEEAILNGYVPMSRLDDAVERILTLKEKLGLFEHGNQFRPLTEEDRRFVFATQKKTAEASVTLIRDNGHFFPLSPGRMPKIILVPVTHYEPALQEAQLMKAELEQRGFSVTWCNEIISKEQEKTHDLIIYALFSRPFRPIGFLDFHDDEARKILHSIQTAVEKTLVVSFGSPYFGNQYFERALTYINAYSMLAPSVKAFVRAAAGEIPFSHYSPVKL